MSDSINYILNGECENCGSNYTSTTEYTVTDRRHSIWSNALSQIFIQVTGEWVLSHRNQGCHNRLKLSDNKNKFDYLDMEGAKKYRKQEERFKGGTSPESK